MQFSLLPNPNQVFFDDVEKHSEVLIPLLSIELNDVEPALNGLVHFVLPLEPFDTVGLETTQYHTYYSRCNWLAYNVKDGKISLETDFNFIQYNYVKAHPDFKSHFDGVDIYLDNLPKDLSDELSKIKRNYLKITKKYLSYSETPNKFLKYFEQFPEPYEDIEDSFPSAVNPKDNIPYPLTKDGRMFKYIGTLDVTDFVFYDENRKQVSLGHDLSIILYYDPVDNIVLNTFYGT